MVSKEVKSGTSVWLRAPPSRWGWLSHGSACSAHIFGASSFLAGRVLAHRPIVRSQGGTSRRPRQPESPINASSHPQLGVEMFSAVLFSAVQIPSKELAKLQQLFHFKINIQYLIQKLMLRAPQLKFIVEDWL